MRHMRCYAFDRAFFAFTNDRERMARWGKNLEKLIGVVQTLAREGKLSARIDRIN